MKALRASAQWAPRATAAPSAEETATKRVNSGSLYFKAPRLEFIDLPEPVPAPDELLLRVRYCGICGSDIHVYESDAEGYIIFSGPARLPSVLGHEYTAEVVGLGKDVRGFKKGDIVTGESILWCGQCLACRQGALNQCENVELMGLTADGAFAELITMKAKYCWDLSALNKVMDQDALLKAGTLVEPVGCAYNGIYVSAGGVTPGDFAIVYGAGPIGLGAVALLRATGCARVFVVDVVEERLKLALRMGAEEAFNPKITPDLKAALMRATSGRGADMQVEAAGAPDDTVPLMQALASPRGKIVYLGRAGSHARVDLNRIVSGAHSIIGSRGHSGYGIFPKIIRMMEGRRLPAIEEMVTSVYPLAKAEEAFLASRKRTDGKILIKVT